MNENKKSFFLLLLINCILFSLISCDFNPSDIFFNKKNIKLEDFENATENDEKLEETIDHNGDKQEKIAPPVVHEKLWDILIYMAADNNLESAALEDIVEMECSNLNTDLVSVFILLDRSKSYDTSNDNWTGTRLYRLKTGRNKNRKNMISQEISCKDLGVFEGIDNDLEMSSNYVLSDFISFIKEKYPANNYGMIIWGHGTGWRNISKNCLGSKGFAYDDTTNSYMTLKQLKHGFESGLNGDKFKFVGFDTCFGGELEVMYELRNLSDYAIGTEGLLELNGWNYNYIFNCFESEKDKSPLSLAKIIVKSFSIDYENSLNSSIVAVDMSEINNYFKAFDGFMQNIAKLINCVDIRDKIINNLFYDNKNRTFCYGENNSDLYIDSDNLVNSLTLLFEPNKDLVQKQNDFNLAKEKCIVDSWASFNSKGGLGVYFATMSLGNTISGIHPQGYIKNKISNQIDFVKDSNGYVPTANQLGSFLDKIFY